MLTTEALDQEMRSAATSPKAVPSLEERCDLLEKQIEYLSELLNAVMAGTSNSLRRLEALAEVEPDFRPWEIGEPYAWLKMRARIQEQKKAPA